MPSYGIRNSGPPKPPAVVATPGTEQISASWAAVPGAKRYTVTLKQGSTVIQTVSTTGTSYTKTGLTAGQNYTVEVQTQNIIGNSTTASSSATTLSSSLTGTVTTLAGSTAGYTDATGTLAQFSGPAGVALDSSGNVYVADQSNHSIRKVTPAGVVTTLAGQITSGNTNGTGAAAQFYSPAGVAVDSSGNVYVADRNNNRIRKVTPAGVVTTLAGSSGGYTDATGTMAKFNAPVGVALDSSGNVYVADANNNRIRKVTPAGVVTTLAGSTAGYNDANGIAAQFNNPNSVTVDSTGNVYVADQGNQRIRKVTSEGVVTTLAGSTSGFADATGASAQFSTPNGVAVDPSGNVYVADYTNHRIRKITPEGTVTTLAGQTAFGTTDATGTAAQFRNPTAVAVDSVGNVYVADRNNNRIRKIT